MQPPPSATRIPYRPGLWLLMGLSLVLHAGLLAFGPGWYLALSGSLRDREVGAAVADPLLPAVPATQVQPVPVEPPATDPGAVAANAERPPVATRRIAPAYPDIARRAQIEGRVVARFLVDERGRVARLDSMDGPVVFREVVAAAVRRWEFAPAMQGGRAVGVWVRAPFVFSLEGGVPADHTGAGTLEPRNRRPEGKVGENRGANRRISE